MKTIYYTATSLDGFIADREHSLEWLIQFGDPGSDYLDFLAGVGAIAMGSTTYKWVLDNLVRPGADDEQPWPYDQPTWVFTSRGQVVPDDADVRFAAGDVEPVHRRMVEAAGGKDLWVVGGGELAGKFHDRGLLDEIVVQVAPVTLGGGAPLFPRAIASPPLRLTSVEKLGAGFAQLRYAIPR